MAFGHGHPLVYLYNIHGWSSFRGRSAVTALGDKTSFGPPFVFCVLELSRKSPCLWACFHSLSPLLIYNIPGWSSFPSIRPVIRPVIQVPHPWMKKMMELDDDDDSWRRPQFIQLFLCGQQQVRVEAAEEGRHLLSVFFLPPGR